jgi:flagellar biosynthesis/type III secretory pathway chaperone
MPDHRLPSQAGGRMTPREAITAFIALLEREQLVLAQPQAEALEAIAVEKQALLTALQSPAARAVSGSSPAQDASMRALVERAQHLNQMNSRLLNMQRTFCDSRLRLLQGGNAGDGLYHANGLQ